MTSSKDSSAGQSLSDMVEAAIASLEASYAALPESERKARATTHQALLKTYHALLDLYRRVDEQVQQSAEQIRRNAELMAGIRPAFAAQPESARMAQAKTQEALVKTYAQAVAEAKALGERISGNMRMLDANAPTIAKIRADTKRK